MKRQRTASWGPHLRRESISALHTLIDRMSRHVPFANACTMMNKDYFYDLNRDCLRLRLRGVVAVVCFVHA